MAEEYKKCDGRAIVCPPLGRRLGDGHVKGFNALQIIDMRTGEDLTPVLVYKLSPWDKGLVLNFCPFCGSELNLDYQLKEMVRDVGFEPTISGLEPEALGR